MSKLSRHRRNTRQSWDDTPGLFDLADEGDGSDELPELDSAALARPECLRFISFGSGSSGNCAYLGTSSCGILIDAGVDNNRVTEALRENAISMESIRGIILTHDHGDHIRYAYALLRYNRHLRLFATPKTLNGILRRHNISRRIQDYHTPIYKEFPFKAGDLTITAFETSHDGSDNAGFSIEGAGTTFVVTTDTGMITERADYYIRRCSHLMIESNYDADMLRQGRYPMHLKARIASSTGHLDNRDTARYLASLCPTAIRNIFLCHLSLDNNTPEIALGTVRRALEDAGMNVAGIDATPEERQKSHICLYALPRMQCSPLLTLGRDE